MTKIKRLSDEDIKRLKTCQPCEDCPLYDVNNGIDRACWIYVNKSRMAKCKDIKNEAIRLEMEARERDKMEEKKQLPTESELRAELENACIVINNYSEYGKLVIVKEYQRNEITVNHEVGHDDSFVLSRAQFRPDIEPPDCTKIVAIKDDSGVYWPFVSRGKFDCHSRLEVEDSWRVSFFKEWCVIDGKKQTKYHSAGWDMAWLEGVE